MFIDHFHMTALPFCENLQADRILRDERIAQGLARLEYLTAAGTLALITGPTGVGKSSLVKLFLAGLNRHRYWPLYVHLTHVRPSGLLRLVVLALGETPISGKEQLFLQILQKARHCELTPLLVLDEAHLIAPEALTDLRLLISSALDDAPPLKIVLSAQESLRDQLQRSNHADLVHRISVRYQVPPMSRPQTSAYIDHHLTRVGASERIFENQAKGLIHDYAAGLPRQINNLATACLINAAARNLQRIDEPLVNDTLAEFPLS
jgi:general secretion pathway protein A